MDRFVIPGEPAIVPFGYDINCESRDFPRPTSAWVEVWRPDGGAVSATLEVPSSAFSIEAGGNRRGTWRAQALFTPDSLGLWRLRATFEPDAGQLENYVLAVEPRFDAGMRVVLAPSGMCRAITITDRGNSLCIRGSRPPHSLSGPGVELPFDAFSVVAQGDVVWRVVDGGLERFVDDGVGLQRSHVGQPSMFHEARLAFAGDDVWVADNDGTRSTLRRGSPLSDGGIFLSPPQYLYNSNTSWLVGAKNEVLLGSDYQPIVVLIREDAGINIPGLPPLPPLGSKYDARTAWIHTNSGELVGVRLAVGGVVSGRLDERWNGQPDPFFGFTPLFTAGSATSTSSTAAVPRVTAPTLTFELYDPGPLFGPISCATERYAISRSLDDTQLKVFER